MKPFMPKLVYFEPKALEYPLGKELYEKFTKMGLEIRETTSIIKLEICQARMICKNIVMQRRRLLLE